MFGSFQDKLGWIVVISFLICLLMPGIFQQKIEKPDKNQFLFIVHRRIKQNLNVQVLKIIILEMNM